MTCSAEAEFPTVQVSLMCAHLHMWYLIWKG